MKPDNHHIITFEGKKIRQIELEGEIYFNVVDVIEAVTETPDASKYWYKVKKKMIDTEGVHEKDELSPIWRKLPFKNDKGKIYQMEAANRKGIFRILMSVPSPKVEPFRVWLAEVGEERVAETENPELGFERIRQIYRDKGYSEEWIVSRLKSIDIRKLLTDEWKLRGVKEGQEYALLTAEIAKSTFGITPSEHAQLKGLEKENLRDHMSNLELIFTMLGEEATRQVAIREDAQGYNDNHDAAKRGGAMAGDARKSFEKRENLKVVTNENFLNQLDKPKTDDSEQA